MEQALLRGGALESDQHVQLPTPPSVIYSQLLQQQIAWIHVVILLDAEEASTCSNVTNNFPAPIPSTTELTTFSAVT